MFTDRDRAIFPYHDGIQEVAGDPLEIDKRMLSLLDGDINGAIARAWPKPTEAVTEDGMPILGDDGEPVMLAPIETPETYEAFQRFVGAVREAFQLPTFDKTTRQGMTMSMVLAVWRAYTDWQKKSAASFGG